MNIKQEWFETYPDVFRKLEWWEERDFVLEGMYIRFGALDKRHSYYQIIKLMDGEERPYGFWQFLSATGTGEYCYPLWNSYPATKEEFERQMPLATLHGRYS